MRLILCCERFSDAIETTKGVFNLQLARALLGEGHEVDVVSPVPWYDEWKATRNGVKMDPSRQDVMDGVHVHYPRYYLYAEVRRPLRPVYVRFVAQNFPVRFRAKPSRRGSLPTGPIRMATSHSRLAARRIGRPCIVMVGGSDVPLLRK